MQWREILPAWQGGKSVNLYLLCVSMLCFPFSVAATNVGLGLLLFSGVVTGCWWQGVQALWQRQRRLFSLLLLYLAMIVVGMLWSLDVAWGGHVLARHWFWLLLPIVVCVLAELQYRRVMLLTIAVSMGLNLVLCVLQANGVVDIVAEGSNLHNPTGFIGHTSFGLMYGVWSGWLVHWGLMRHDRWRYAAWLMAVWSVVMVFMAQGQSGYIVTIASLLVVGVKWAGHQQFKKLVPGLMGVMLIAGVVLMFGPGHERLEGTWQALTQKEGVNNDATQSMAKASTLARLTWWSMSIDIWRQGAFFGAGTGGFPKAAKIWRDTPSMQHGYINQYSQIAILHPHNHFLITLVRFGVVGEMILLLLLFVWIRTGLSVPWQGVLVRPLITLSGLALALHGLDSPSFEEHYSALFSVMMFGVGLSELCGDGEMY